MKRMLKYKDGSIYIDSPSLSLIPNDIIPVEVIDLEGATHEELRELRKNPRRQDILDRVKQQHERKKNR